MSEIAQRQRAPTVPLLKRERAILEFNRRVLAQATRADVPLLERLRYLCIVSSNLDEFFEVRFADVLEAATRKGSGTTAADVEAIGAAAHALVDAQYAAFNRQVMPALAAAGIGIVHHDDRDERERRWVARFFAAQVRPLLVPIGVDPSHPFPQVANKSLNFVARLAGKDAFGRRNTATIVKVPRVLPRVIELPRSPRRAGQSFVLLTSVIRSHLGELFPGREVEAFSHFRITRDSDLEVDPDVKNLRQALRSGLRTRHFGQAVRLEVVDTCPDELAEFLLRQFGLAASALYRVHGPVNLVRLNELIELANAPALRFAPFEPALPAGVRPGVSMFARLRAGDLLLHHPFESFAPVVELLREAVRDPAVLAIKQTIYRAGSESPVMHLLIEAARAGKEVTAVVELKARFEEEANINWAERLEAVGAQVVYGVAGLKTHAKMLLVTRREGGELRRYAHLSTGNYNPETARLYTDLGHFSADPELTADVDAVFQRLASLGRTRPLKVLLQAPFTLHTGMLARIAQVSEAAHAGRRARIVVKVNALTDAALIEALVGAARRGAAIDLIVRGACLLAPAALGLADRIRVRSIVGRFLEHSRVAYFRWGDGDDDEALYLSSADWMGRNMFGRIEVSWPLRDPALRQRVIDECLAPYLLDSEDAWLLGSDATYHRAPAGGKSAQQALLARYARTPPASWS
jgi:polyphosphate kinase